MDKKTNILSILYLLSVIVIIPLFGLYNFPGTSVNFMNIGLIAILILCVVSRIYIPKVQIDIVYVPLLIYIALQTIYACLCFDLDTVSLILAVGQYLGFIFLLAFFNKELFDINLAKKILLFIADIACIYILIQQAASTFLGINIGAGIPFLEVSNEVIATYTEGIEKYNLGYRPRSLFSEPAMFAIYVLLAMTIELYDVLILKKQKKKDCFRIIIYFLGLIVARSSLGIITMSVLLITYFLYFTRKQKKLSLYYFVGIIGVILILIAFSQTSFIQFQINRLFYGDVANEERLRFLFDFSALDLTTWNTILLGHDFKLLTYTGEYLPSFFRQLYCFGILGELLLFILLIQTFIRIKGLQKIIFLVFIIEMLGSEIIHGSNFLLYFIWLLPLGRRDKNVYKKLD